MRLTGSRKQIILAFKWVWLGYWGGGLEMEMYSIPQISPISDLKHRHLDVFRRLKQGPVILANRSQPAAVLVSPERWNAIIQYIDDLECGIEALQTELAVARGEDEFERLAPAEIEDWLGDNGLPN